MHWDFPYASQRMPVMAGNVVATSQPLAAQAGLRMLLAGGNAVDAAIATAIALTVVEPCNNGIGGDAFAIVWDGRKLHGLNSSGRSPRAWTRERFDRYDTMPLRGWDSVTVPGAPAAWTALSKRFGRLDFEALFQPAIEYARDGFVVSPRTAEGWAHSRKAFAAFPEFIEAFCPRGRAPRCGEYFAQKDQARTLRQIARTHGEAFYRGALAKRIAKHAKATGGVMTVDDLAAYGFRLSTSRRPRPLETEILVERFRFERDRMHEAPAAVNVLLKQYPIPASVPRADYAAWIGVANVLLNLDEVVVKN